MRNGYYFSPMFGLSIDTRYLASSLEQDNVF